MTQYVLGFAFNRSKTVVVLIEKTKPAWQAGKLNGVGGKIEPGESPDQAMVREFKEEAGVITELTDWKQFAFFIGRDFSIACYKLFSDEVCFGTSTMTDERVNQYDIEDLDSFQVVDNVYWLVPMAIDPDSGDKFIARIVSKL